MMLSHMLLGFGGVEYRVSELGLRVSKFCPKFGQTLNPEPFVGCKGLGYKGLGV